MTKQIKLRAVNGLTQGPLALTPCKDAVTGKLRGVSESQGNSARKVDENTVRKISEGLILDLEKSEVDRIDWEWIRHNKEIVGSLEEGLSNPQALFYVDQPDLQVEKRIKRSSQKFEAEKIIYEASEIRRAEICRILGQDVKAFRPIDIMDYLIGKAENAPGQIIDAANDPDAKEKLFIFRCMDAGKIKKDMHGTYRYGDMVLGVNIRSVIEWLTNERNRDLVAKLYESLHGPVAAPKSMISEFDEDLKRSQNKGNGSSQDGESGEGIQL